MWKILFLFLTAVCRFLSSAGNLTGAATRVRVDWEQQQLRGDSTLLKTSRSRWLLDVVYRHTQDGSFSSEGPLKYYNAANNCLLNNGNPGDLAFSLGAFTSNLYHAVRVNSNDNLFLSPYSIATSLSMLYLGARSNTAKQLEDILNISFLKKRIHFANNKYLNLMQSDSKNFTLKSANRIYMDLNFPVSDYYKTKLNQFYLSTIENVDFANNAPQITDAVNKWVFDYTNGKIQNLISPGDLNAYTVLVLLNAVYFKGRWAEKFPKRLTSKRYFFLKSGQTAKRDTMYMSEKFYFRHDRNFGCKILELPYVGNSLSMFVVLPDEIDGLSRLEQKLNLEFFQSLAERKGFRKREVEVFLPKFRLKNKFNLNKIFPMMGLNDIFNRQKSDLSKMVSNDRQLYVNEIIHKAFVEVNEEGTEAAAVTITTIHTMSGVVDPPRFEANHPFFFSIIDKRFNIPLFVGRVMDPQM